MIFHPNHTPDQHNLEIAKLVDSQLENRKALADQSHLECGWTNECYLVPIPRWIAIPSFPMPAHRPDYFPSTPKLLG